MNIREFQEKDREAVEKIFALHWTDPEFLKELSSELHLYVQSNPEGNSLFFIAEEGEEIIGIAGFKKLPNYLKPYATTNNPVEFYVIAVKEKRKGVGQKLTLKLIEEAKKLRFSEILLYSPHTHSESWNFYEKLGFERVGEITPPDDEIGQLWRIIL